VEYTDLLCMVVLVLDANKQEWAALEEAAMVVVNLAPTVEVVVAATLAVVVEAAALTVELVVVALVSLKDTANAAFRKLRLWQLKDLLCHRPAQCTRS